MQRHRVGYWTLPGERWPTRLFIEWAPPILRWIPVADMDAWASSILSTGWRNAPFGPLQRSRFAWPETPVFPIESGLVLITQTARTPS